MFNLKLFSFLLILLGAAISASTLAQNCGDVITSDVRLTRSLNCDFGYHIFEVQANNVTIDLNGHTLSGGDGLIGIANQGFDNLTVKNGSIEGMEIGVLSNHSSGLKVQDITFDKTEKAVESHTISRAVIERNKFIVVSSAIFLTNSGSTTNANFNQIRNNEFYESSLGIRFCGINTDSNSITNNVFWKTGGAIFLSRSRQNLISGNQIIDSDYTPIRLNNASSNQVVGNTLIGTDLTPPIADLYGIWLSTDAINSCLSNLEEDIRGSENNTISNNYISGFPIGVEVGSGYYNNPILEQYFGVEPIWVNDNQINYNQINDNRVGVRFRIDALQNNAENNRLRGNLTSFENGGLFNTF